MRSEARVSAAGGRALEKAVSAAVLQVAGPLCKGKKKSRYAKWQAGGRPHAWQSTPQIKVA